MTAKKRPTTKKRPAAETKKRSFIDPTRLYSLFGLREDSGISATRMREARHSGIDLPTLKVGRRVFVRGQDAIEYIERLATLGQ